MIKNQTWIVLVVFALLAGGMYYINAKGINKETDNGEPTSSVVMLFAPEEGLVSSIQVDTTFTQQSVSVELGADGKWMVKLPVEGEADPAQAGAAASQISSLRNMGAVDADLEILGLDKPEYVLTLKFSSNKTHKLEIGSITPTQSGYYARLDEKSVFIVSKDGIDALLSLSFAPPYISTPTASPAPATATPIPVEITPTP